MYRVFVAACLAACFASPAEAGLFHRNTGCQGYQAQGCTSAQAGCTSTQASCYGGSGGCHGGHGGRFHVFPLFQRRHRESYSVPSATLPPPQVNPMPKSAAEAKTTNLVALFETFEASADALGEVNAARSKRGLRPFQRDEQLTIGAQRCAEYRAQHRMAGHTHNDFAYLPEGASAKAAGCAALEPSWGWGSCCTYENWTFAGAAIVVGNDNRRYMQLFVR